MKPLRSRLARTLGVALALGLVLAPAADARRGGSFGSRGARTYSAPRSTATAPGYVPPVQRSMTGPSAARPAYGAYSPGYGYNNGAFYRRPGFGGGFVGGLLTGGLIGGLMGHGFGWGGGYGGMGGGWGGGGGGIFAVIIQLAILFFVVSLVMRFFRRRSAGYAPFQSAFQGPQPAYGGFGGAAGYGGSGFGGATAVPPTGPAWEFDITPQDRDAFERLLHDVQDAFGREDYAALREHTTPEVMSYLAEELSDNATHGRRNEVTGAKLLQADVGEAWREGQTDYATAAMRYESIDIMRDRTTNAALSGDPNTPTQTTELWTFARQAGGPWKLSAIQET
jgi:predicted lipid-binding transport protein (Tim44 family)